MEKKMEQSMEGKVALITGGGTGLGAAVARRLASNGASIVVTGRREGLIKTIAEETGGSCEIKMTALNVITRTNC